MTKGKSTLIQREPPKKKKSKKKNDPTNYRPITCLPMMLKILTAESKKIYDSLISRRLFLEEPKDAASEREEL